jgi:16S rRNA (adenine1518-N6/adenine1519-N6)-dimethyltransferase
MSGRGRRSGPQGAKSPAEGPSPRRGATVPRQVSLARLAEFGLEPKRRLGQNFLIDDNIVSVILAQVGCGPQDVVLEVGAGLGVLTAALARQVAHVHAFEVDRSLEPALRATLGDDAPVTLHFEDVLEARLETLAPPPTLCASNLPYQVAGAFVIEALQRLPDVRRYCLMVQREVAERMAAGAGSKVYGLLSVWVQLYTRVTHLRPLSRTIFYPRPHVDSSLIVLERRPAEELPAVPPRLLGAVLQAAFGQRRKTLLNALAAGLGLPRPVVEEILSDVGVGPHLRAEQVGPPQLAAVALHLGGRLPKEVDAQPG